MTDHCAFYQCDSRKPLKAQITRKPDKVENTFFIFIIYLHHCVCVGERDRQIKRLPAASQNNQERKSTWVEVCSVKLLLFSCSVMSDSLRLHGLQHARSPCPSLSPQVCSNSCPLGWWCHPTIICHPLLILPSIFLSIRVFSKESALHIRWAKY